MQEFNHLKAVNMDGTDNKDNSLINIILGRSECTQINKKYAPQIGTPGETITEYTQPLVGRPYQLEKKRI